MTRLMSTLGLVFGPQLVKPFLGWYDKYADIVNTTLLPPEEDLSGIDPIQWAYIVVAALNVFTAMVLVITSTWFSIGTGQCTSVQDVVFQSDDLDEDIEVIPGDEFKAPAKSVSDRHPLRAEPRPDKIDPCSLSGRVLVGLIFVAFLTNAGTSVMYVSLLYTYLYEYRGWSVQAATSILSWFHMVRFIIGAVVVFVARWISPTWLVIIDLATMLLSSVMMLAALGMEDRGDMVTAIGVMVASIGDSNILPSLISLAEESMNVTAGVMSVFIVANPISLMVIGPVGGTLLNYSVVAYPLTLLVLILLCIVALVFYYGLLLWLKQTGRWPQQEEPVISASPVEKQ